MLGPDRCGSHALATFLPLGGVNNWGYVKTLSQPAVAAVPGFTSNAGGVGFIETYWADGGGSHASVLQKAHGVPYYDDYTVTSTTVSPGFGRSTALSGNTLLAELV